ncbi:MAG: sensor histidine kinase, partial [Rhodocyclaceae bacterium]
KTVQGQFSTRLPLYPVPELMRLARSFNAMNDRLDEAVRHNVLLESEQAVAVRINARLEDERTAIARELHDELAQGITAVRALAGAIAQRTRDNEQLHGTAQSILAVTGEMQQEVRGILQRLRPSSGLAEALERHLLAWRGRHSGIRLEAELGDLPALDEAQSQALLRLVQEGLTNVVRHADARCVRVRLFCDGSHAIAEVADDGRGLKAARQTAGFGLVGLKERVTCLGGQLVLETPVRGGTLLRATLPLASEPFPQLSLETVSCLP